MLETLNGTEVNALYIRIFSRVKVFFSIDSIDLSIDLCDICVPTLPHRYLFPLFFQHHGFVCLRGLSDWEVCTRLLQ